MVVINLAHKRLKLGRRSRTKLAVVDRDLKLGKGAILIAENETIVVHGKIKNKGGFKVKGNLECRSIEVEKGSVKINGDLKAERDVEVDVKLIVNGSLTAEDVSAGMTVKIKGDAKAEKISAGMKVVVDGSTEAETISAGSKIELNGKNTVGKFLQEEE